MSATPSAQYSLTIRAEIAHRPGMLGQVATAIGRAGGVIGSVDLVEVAGDRFLRDITVDAAEPEQWKAITGAVDELEGVRVVDTTDRTFLMHVGGKIEQRNESPLRTRDDLSMAYTPGVARVCTAIAEDRDKAFQYTIKRNTVSGGRIFDARELRRMSDDAMVFAMANPTPEGSPEEASEHARIVATGRSDYPNQINNVLCFPGIFRGALDVRAREISEDMTARAIARIIPEAELREDYFIPSVFNRDVAPAVAAAVAEQAKSTGEATAAGDTIGFAAIDAERMRAG